MFFFVFSFFAQPCPKHGNSTVEFFLTKGPAFHVTGPAFHVTANFYIIGFVTGWSYFSMSFDGLGAKVDCDWLSFAM
jgi:hypothetical protein